MHLPAGLVKGKRAGKSTSLSKKQPQTHYVLLADIDVLRVNARMGETQHPDRSEEERKKPQRKFLGLLQTGDDSSLIARVGGIPCQEVQRTAPQGNLLPRHRRQRRSRVNREAKDRKQKSVRQRKPAS